MPPGTVYEWIHRGWVTAESGDFYIIRADVAELARLRRLRAIRVGHRPP
jgi:hypothetical protein